MAAQLQIRRGTSFGILTPSEPFFLTPNYTLNIGTNGSGGYITLVNLNVTNSGNIVLSGDITATDGVFTNNVDITGDLYVGGDITLGNAGTDTIFVGAPLSGSLIPTLASTYDLGSPSKPWRNLYADGAFITNVTASNVDFGDIENLPSGLVSSSIQVDHNTTTNYSASRHIDHNILYLYPGAGLDTPDRTGPTYYPLTTSRTLFLDTGSTHFINAVNDLNNIVIPSGTVSGSSQLTSSYDLLYEEIANGTHTLVSGSSQITYTQITGISAGIVSGSEQLPSGLVSGSSQINYPEITNLPTLWSGSEQLPSGLVSGSSQLTSSLNVIYEERANSTHTLVSGSSQLYTGLDSRYEARANATHTLVSGSSQINYPDISNIPSGIISGSTQLDGTTINNLNGTFTGSFTGSFYGDGSQLTGVTAYTDTDTLDYINSISVLSGSIDLGQLLIFTSSIQAEVDTLSSHTGSYLLNSFDTFYGELNIVNVATTVVYTEDFSVSLGDFTTYGDANWYQVTDTGSEDTYSARSGVIGNNQTSSLELIKTTSDTSTLRYDYFTSTEEFSDFLRVYVNGNLKAEYSGISTWESDSIIINETGTVTVKFVYEKNSAASGSEDAVWVDTVSWITGGGGVLNVDGLITAPNFTGSFVGDGSGLTGITVSTDTSSLVSTNGDTMTGNLGITGSLLVTGETYFDGDLTVTGIITAQEFHTQFVSASVIYQSGSTKFGDTIDDVHEFTGSVYISGSISASLFNGDGSGLTNLTLSSGIVSGSDQLSGSFEEIASTTHTLVSGSSQLTASLDTRYQPSGSISTLPSGVISGSSQLDGTTINNLSGSFSGSFQGDGSGLTGISGGSGITWSVITTDINASGSNGYITNSGGQITLTLPNTNTIETVRVTGKGVGGWKVLLQNPFNMVFVDQIITGSIESTERGDSVELLCIGDDEWQIISSVGNIIYN